MVTADKTFIKISIALANMMAFAFASKPEKLVVALNESSSEDELSINLEKLSLDEQSSMAQFEIATDNRIDIPFADIEKCPKQFIKFKSIIEEFQLSKLIDLCGQHLNDDRRRDYIENRDEVKAIILINLFNAFEEDGKDKNIEFYKNNMERIGQPKNIKILQKFILRCMSGLYSRALTKWKNELIFNRKTLCLAQIPLNYIPVKAFKVFNQLQSLDLSETDLKEGFDVLSEIKNLRGLSIKRNGIRNFPDFTKLPNLEAVNLSDNNLHCVELDQYLSEDGNTCKKSNISGLNFDGNKISELPHNFFDIFPDVNSLSLYDNPIQENEALRQRKRKALIYLGRR